MTSLSFFKYQAQGNHFILVDDRTFFFPTNDAKLIQRLCHSCFGIGADGLIALQPSKDYDIRMRIFNSDGMEAESCGNGLFCVARLLSDLGFSEEKVSIELKDSSASIRFVGARLSLKLGSYRDLCLNQSIQANGKQIHFHRVNTGVPHAVIFLKDLRDLNIENLGKKIRQHDFFQPQGTNVNFVSIDAPNKVFVRTYERGVEKETYSCGTGAWAVAVISSLIHPMQDSFEIHHPGGTYEMKINRNIQDLEMLGSASKVFTGSLDIG